jgi:methionine sulfoxide reductase heme-binding subunit
MSPASWYAARSAGILAYLLLSCSVVVGVSMSSKRKLKWPRFAVQEVHRFLSLLTGLFIVIHGGSLLLDRVVPYSLTQVIVPFTSSYRPLTVGLGVAAADLLAAVAVTNALRTRLPYSFWRRAHYATIAVWLGATGHAFLSGTDRHDVWFLALVGSAAAAVVATFGARFSRRPVARTPARAAA